MRRRRSAASRKAFRNSSCLCSKDLVVGPTLPSGGDLIRRRISKRFGLKSKGLRMGASFIPLIIFTIIFAVVAILLPIFVPKNPYRGVVQVSLFLTGTCMWFFWIFTYMTQMNPLIGPILNQRALIAVKNYWGDAWQDEV